MGLKRKKKNFFSVKVEVYEHTMVGVQLVL